MGIGDTHTFNGGLDDGGGDRSLRINDDGPFVCSFDCAIVRSGMVAKQGTIAKQWWIANRQ